MEIAKSSLTHFLLLGGVLFWLFPAPGETTKIKISRAHMENLYALRAQELGISGLSASQKTEVRSRWLQDELVFREALRLGLDKEDSIIRQRLIQKAWFLAQPLGGASVAPSERELRHEYEKNRQRWQHPSAVRFWHVYVRAENVGKLDVLRKQLQRMVVAKKKNLPDVGDAFALGRDVPLTSVRVLESLYGRAFVRGLEKVSLEEWSQPLRSRYGWHLVLVWQRTKARVMSWEEAKEQVQSDWMLERKHRVERLFVQQLKQRYPVQEIP